MFFDPRFLFCAIWILELGAYICIQSLLGEINFELIAIVIGVVLVFVSGANLARRVLPVAPPAKGRFAAADFANDNPEIEAGLNFVFAVACVGITIGTWQLWSGTGFPAYSDLRDIIVEDASNEHRWAWYGNILLFGTGLCIFAISFYASKARVQLAYFLVALGFSILSTGRIGLLLLSISAFFLLSRQGKLTGLKVLLLVILFSAMALGVAFVLGKGVAYGDSTIFQLVWNPVVYAFGGTGAFDHYLTTGEPIIGNSILLPSWARGLIIAIGYNVGSRDAFLPFVGFPLPTNVYTAFFSYYHDLGMIGLLCSFFVYGIIHQGIYERFGKSFSPFGQYFYCISIFPLVMTFFDDIYFVSLGFWISLAAPIFVVYITAKLRARSRNKRDGPTGNVTRY